ncbi:AAA family ATPase [Pseudodesulfovibrio portus]|uniref:Protein CR006 P-loop domain-containing protein n=1 Tax=Pseudodesulfovibrio portus TaxID=231439 RepID=A0ABN6RXI6_9BACT|nr:AAA family ATPase [Pseudodesulfovibrio portus]BDQ34820.1 hypothetical protein JCM14722_23620 [Pseudodesulfovibrio portus]
MISKISNVCDFGPFSKFNWDTTVKDQDDNIIEFNKLNIIYGRNYSGKTTLSRILRSIKQKSVHEDYLNAKFDIEHSTCGSFCQDDLEDIDVDVRVYNSDFVKDNLKWLQDKDGNIQPFAIVGSKNIEIEKKVKTLENEIGNEKSGLTKESEETHKRYLSQKTLADKTEKNLEGKLRDQAREIKNNSVRYNVPTYNIASIKTDIRKVHGKKYTLTEEEQVKHQQTINETVRPNIEPRRVVIPNYEKLVESATNLLTKEISPSKTIKELLEDPNLQEWVRKGSQLHRGKRNLCAFCGNEIPSGLWEKIDAHFNKESETLRKELQTEIEHVDNEIDLFKSKVVVPDASIYSQLRKQIYSQQDEANNFISEYKKNLNKLKKAINKRLNNIFATTTYDNNYDNADKIVIAIENINKSIEQNNLLTSKIDEEKVQARQSLRLHTVQTLLSTIDYDKEKQNILDQNKNRDSLKEERDTLINLIERKRLEIRTLKSELSDETKGAEEVNNYLRHFFGHDALTLSSEKDETGSRFVLKRGEEKAHNLSEGECSLVAFCYFIAKLQEAGFESKNSIIWIDDPISSLDNNHVFFTFSLIENALAKNQNYEQLFISTHNLEFLKYLKRLTWANKEKKANFFIIENDSKCARLRPMPSHLKKYITEFNYLFSVIYKCAHPKPNGEDTFDYYYSFGNNLRKFLEAYLFYKYPNQTKVINKIDRFFDGDHQSTKLVNRVINEYSHLEEIFDRSTTPIDIPEMKKSALYVLDTIKCKDPDQYEALLTSVNIVP